MDMQWIRHNLMAVILVGAIIVSFAVTRSESHHREDRLKQSDIASCVRENTRSALQAAYQLQTAAVRRKTGDVPAAESYEAFARGTEAFLAAPRGLGDRERMVAVEKVGAIYRLTPEAYKLIRRGCMQAWF